MNLTGELARGSRIAIVYDATVRSAAPMARIKQAVGTPTLVNARERPDLVRCTGVDLNSGVTV